MKNSVDSSSAHRPHLLAAVLSSLLIASTAAAQIHDAAKDYSFVDNPHGSWSYGSTLNAEAPFSLTSTSIAQLGGQLLAWTPTPQGSTYPFVMKPFGTAPVTWGTTIYPAHSLALHPEHFGRFAAVEFTAPVTGAYDLQSRFFDIPNDVIATVDLRVRLNGTILFSGALGPQQSSAPFAQRMTLNAGDHLDFLVGSQGPYFYDHTGLDATLQRVEPNFVPVPEPSTYGLIGVATLGVASILRRRRSGLRVEPPTSSVIV